MKTDSIHDTIATEVARLNAAYMRANSDDGYNFALAKLALYVGGLERCKRAEENARRRFRRIAYREIPANDVDVIDG